MALIASQSWIATRPATPSFAPEGSERTSLSAPPFAMAALAWKVVAGDPTAGSEVLLPVVLLHGSPGEAADLADLAARLAASGREVLSLDLPGFGASVAAPGGRSTLDHAHGALACVPWSEFHVAAWSMGGGVALHMAQLAPERVRSLSLIASIGVQEAEGSGSYYFEHFKYALSWALLVPGAELIPHFGLLGERASRRAFCENFWQSDQRPLRAILSALKTPLLIAHGRRDFLVPLWCAEESHALAPASRLLVFDASHFLLFEPPFGQLDGLAPEMLAFLARHDSVGTPEPGTRVDLSPNSGKDRPKPYWLPRRIPWWLAFAALCALARWRALCCGLVVGSLCSLLQLDLGLGLCAALFGASWRALGTPAGSLLGWLKDLSVIVGACVLASIFVVWASPRLCTLAGPRGGTALSLALPLLVAAAVSHFVRRRRANAAAD